ncbi:MAG: substrate-binding domain-containing protein [Lachnospiraceae bacterium]|nr:substrate-binding domain-containing protein [Lachnospiraceae bacterium]
MDRKAAMEETVRTKRTILFREFGARLASVPRTIFRKKGSMDENTIGVIFSSVSEHAAPRILNSLSSEVLKEGYSLLIRNAGNNQIKEERILKEFIAQNVNGIIIEPSKSEMLCHHMSMYRLLDRLGIPYVFIRSTYPQTVDSPKLLIDDSRGAYLVTRHLIATGRKNIVGLFKADDADGYERHKGYVQALQEAGIAYDPEGVVWFHSEDRTKKPKIVIDQMMKNRRCDAIVCYSDRMAQDLIRHFQNSGLLVPGDIAVTGYGNYLKPERGEVRLTSVDMPFDDMGTEAGKMILSMILGSTPGKKTVMLEPDLVIRGSSIAE